MEQGSQISQYIKINNRQEYVELFAGRDKAEVLKQILDIRKFEIDLYWKRTTFFWTIIAAIIAGYFIIYSSIPAKVEKNSLKALFSLGCLGLIFSTGWYFVNRGSKFWQVNWEKHLDCIEDEVIGPLYKTTIDTNFYRSKLTDLVAPYPFSVSKINQVLNLVLIGFWIFTLGDFFWSFLSIKITSFQGYISFYFLVGSSTVVALFALFAYTHTGLDYFVDNGARRVTSAKFEKRGIE